MVVTVLALSATLLWPGNAAGIPRLDQTGEITLIGRRQKTVPVGQVVGRWKVTAKSIQADVDRARKIHLWWSTDARATLTDGFVRARFQAPSRMNSVLLLRHTPSANAKDGAAHTGYGVEVTRFALKLYRYDRGIARSIARPVKISPQTSVEVVAWMIGPNISVSLFDGKTMRPIASITASDRKYGKGSVGIRMYGRGAGEQVLKLLTVRPAHRQSAVDDAPPSGNATRYLRVSEQDYASLPESLRDALKTMKGAPSPDGYRVLKADPANHERLVRAGVAAAWLDTQTPYLWRSASYRGQVGKALVSTPSGVQIDFAYKDHEMVEAILKAYAARYPKLTRLLSLGKTSGGRDIWALKISDAAAMDEDEPAVMLNGSHHGNELLPVEFTLDAVKTLLEGYGQNQDATRWVNGLEIWIVPLVNPDGNWNFLRKSTASGRKNGRDTDADGHWQYTDGVDLNRNYPFRWASLGELGSKSNRRLVWYRGPHPGSEPETQAMMRLTDSEHFVAAISYHTVSTVILAPYTTNGVTNPTINEAWIVAEEINRQVPRQPNGRRMRVKKQIYPVDGVDQDHFRAAHGTVALLVEGAYHNPGRKKRMATVETTRPTWTALFNRILDRPAVNGRVTDAAGKPVSAQVVVMETRPQMGEVWTSRCRDGRYDRMLPKAGRYQLRVSAPGFVTQTIPFEAASRTPVRLDVVLVKTAPSGPKAKHPRVCGDPVLLSTDHYCACVLDSCVDIAKGPQWCVRSGGCYPLSSSECQSP